ncbi:MAG: hypothetical protein AAGA09_03945 [Pseudomonadota bacterium]
MRKSISVAISALVAGGFLGATSVSAGDGHTKSDSYSYYYSTSQTCDQKEAIEDEKRAEQAKAAKAAPVGPEPMYFGF